jgi:hypothetical protein
MVVDCRNRDSFAELYLTSELYWTFGFLMYDSDRAAATRGTLRGSVVKLVGPGAWCSVDPSGCWIGLPEAARFSRRWRCRRPGRCETSALYCVLSLRVGGLNGESEWSNKKTWGIFEGYTTLNKRAKRSE